MAKTQSRKVLAPILGISRVSLLEAPPEYTSYDSMNMWPFDFRTGRRLCASRCPLNVIDSPSGSGAVNLLARVNGVATGLPAQSMVAARDSDLYYWDGSAWQAATGTQASNIATGVPVAAQAFLQEVIIANSGGKPFVFDYTAQDVELMVETAGTVPNGLSMFCVWNGALVAAGATATPNVLYISRIGDAHDWDFSVALTDTGGAFFTGGEDAGLLRGPINGLIPLNNDVLIISTTEGLVAMQGHPRQGGVVTDVANIAMVGPNAWCRGADGTVYFLVSDGLMKIGGGNGLVPTYVSRSAERPGLGGEVSNVFRFANSVAITLAYEPQWNAIIIQDRVNSRAWLYDIETNGLHPQTMASYSFVTVETPPINTLPGGGRGTLYAGANGISNFATAGTETFDAFLTFNPIDIGGSQGLQSQVTETEVSFGFDGGSVIGTITRPDDTAVITLAPGASPYDALRRLKTFTAKVTGKWTNTIADLRPNGYRAFPRVTGPYLAMKLSLTSAGANARITVESLRFMLTPAGRNRMLYIPLDTV